MRIALVISDYAMLPESGGGYTFVRSIIAATHLHTSGHVFYLVDMHGRATSLPINTDSSSHGVPEGAQFLGSNEPLASRPPPQILPLATPHSPPSNSDILAASDSPSTGGIAQTLADLAIDFLWFMNPGCIDTHLPYVITVWDLEHRNQPFFPEVSTSGWAWEERESFYRRYLPRASAVIVGTEVGKREVIRFYGVHPANVFINQFPSPPAFAASVCTATTLSDSSVSAVTALEGKCFFFYPAQYWPHKNHANLLLALALLRDAHGLMPMLVFTGADKGNKSYVSSLIKNLELDSQVHQLGFVPRDELSRLYANATAMVFPSLFGPDNLPPLEAFAHGCPVLASDGEGPREQLGEAALFFDPLNPSEIAACMASVLGDEPLRLRLIARGMEICKVRTVDAYIARMIAFFDRFEAIRFTWPAGYVHS